MAEKGRFIVLEGIDNCGKTTQAKLLQKYLERLEKKVFLSREPGGTEAGEEIRQVLLKSREPMLDPVTQTLLFYAARKEFLNNVVRPNIDKGVTVISDRFEASTYVYQGFTQGVDLKLIDGLHHEAVAATHCQPDLYIILDIPAEESFKRLKNDDNTGQDLVFEQQGLKFMKKLRAGYLEFVQRNSGKTDSVFLIDGLSSKEDIHQQIIDLYDKQCANN
ncbi:dTMP kinase [Patescibacteria group bacterium]|nr:dTMP kinase [Patescibacteria group bacterium]